ncbi:hypothetical protein [Aquabacter cavernae]|uniref:hypothetical protein n=1 Tax=Aquabacter cavernae TaxID=2496029 RepID=UPI0013E0E30F|nr:hypothetical protein [Aquabacter cavernae]
MGQATRRSPCPVHFIRIFIDHGAGNMRNFKSLTAVAAAFCGSLVALTASSAYAGRGFLVTIENHRSGDVYINVSSYQNWYKYGFTFQQMVPPNEKRTFYTESCEAFLGCIDNWGDHGKRSLKFKIVEYSVLLGEVTIFAENYYKFQNDPASFLCAPPIQHSNFKKPKAGEQLHLRVKVFPKWHIACSSE